MTDSHIITNQELTVLKIGQKFSDYSRIIIVYKIMNSSWMDNMNFFTVSTIFVILIFGTFGNSFASAEIDPLSDIVFLQTGELNTAENHFQISNDITIREFFNGNIVRVSGQTIEGFPYISYSKIFDDKIETRGMIFISGNFVDLTFTEKQILEETILEKNDDLAIIVQYTQRIYSENFAQIDIKTFDQEQNKLNDFYQNYGHIPNTTINVLVFDQDGQEYFSSNGTTNTNGLFETEFLIPENSIRQTLTVTISAETEKSKSSKVLQIFSLGDEPDDATTSPP